MEMDGLKQDLLGYDRFDYFDVNHRFCHHPADRARSEA